MYTWNQIIAELTQSGSDALARVPAYKMQHPRAAGLRQTFGGPFGQRASYRALLSDGTSLCVEDFGHVYEAHLEGPAPAVQPAPRAPATEAVVGLTALGALLGLALGGNKESVITGALLGGVSALATVAVAEADRSPQASRVAVDLAKTMTTLLPLVAETERPARRNEERKFRTSMASSRRSR